MDLHYADSVHEARKKVRRAQKDSELSSAAEDSSRKRVQVERFSQSYETLYGKKKNVSSGYKVLFTALLLSLFHTL
jgi:hypothetical protein